MRARLPMLKIEQVIVHEVPVRKVGAESGDLPLSEIDCELTPELCNYFRERIVDSLSTAASAVVLDESTSSPVPAAISECLGAEVGFVARSQTMARHLHDCQTGVNPSGLLTVVQGRLADTPAVGILKLEKEAALRLEQVVRNEKPTFNLHHLRDLMLSERTRVFKVGLFCRSGEDPAAISGLVCDKQRGFGNQTGVADFFLRGFLGCKLREAPDVATQRFYELTEQYINDKVHDGARKAQYEIALLAELTNTHPVVSPRDFAKAHLAVEDRQPYIESLREGGCADAQFEKDAARIAAHLRRIHVSFANGVAVVASPEAFEKSIRMTDLEDGKTRLEIEEHLKEVQSKR